MKSYFTLVFSITLALASEDSIAQGACGTTLPSIEEASIDELGAEYRRLGSYKNPYCDTTGSDFQLIMQRLAKEIVSHNATQDKAMELMPDAYYHGPLSEYENQKLTIGRDGKAKGKALPPSYKIPTGDYYIVYLWRKKDYLVFALKSGQVIEHTWWEKGNYR